MKGLVEFIDQNEEPLFSAQTDVVPRAGDIVVFSMEATDREKWNDEAWESNKKVSGKTWIVERLWHEFRRLSIDRPAVHLVWVSVKPHPIEDK